MYSAIDVKVKLWKRVSAQLSTEMSNHFIGYKQHIKFKQVKSFKALYHLEDQIGQGAFGTVRAGIHIATETPCAVKVIQKSRLNSNRLRELNKNELEILEQISHPHITRVFELLEDKANYYIVMELMKGGSLAQRIRDDTFFSTIDSQ